VCLAREGVHHTERLPVWEASHREWTTSKGEARTSIITCVFASVCSSVNFPWRSDLYLSTSRLAFNRMPTPSNSPEPSGAPAAGLSSRSNEPSPDATPLVAGPYLDRTTIRHGVNLRRRPVTCSCKSFGTCARGLSWLKDTGRVQSYQDVLRMLCALLTPRLTLTQRLDLVNAG
jgi:hypothetical protein